MDEYAQKGAYAMQDRALPRYGNEYQGHGASPNAVVKETPFMRLSNAVERLREARERVAGVATALCGERGPTGQIAKLNRAPLVGSGMLGGMEELAEQIDGMVDSINEDIARCHPHI